LIFRLAKPHALTEWALHHVSKVIFLDHAPEGAASTGGDEEYANEIGITP